jgi:hypothetical protein
MALLFMASAQAENQLGQCLAHVGLLGDWEWHTENRFPKPPKPEPELDRLSNILKTFNGDLPYIR